MSEQCKHEFSATGDKITCLKCGKEFTRDEFLNYIKGNGAPSGGKPDDGANGNADKPPKGGKSGKSKNAGAKTN